MKYRNLKDLEALNDIELMSKIHPMTKQDDETKLNYLSGLAFVMNIDDTIVSEEKKYFVVLVNAFGCADYGIEYFIEIAKNVDKDQALCFSHSLSSSQVAHYFLADATLLARKDGVFFSDEKHCIEQLAQLCGVPVADVSYINAVVKHIQFKHCGKLTSLLDQASGVNREVFQHLLSLYNLGVVN